MICRQEFHHHLDGELNSGWPSGHGSCEEDAFYAEEEQAAVSAHLAQQPSCMPSTCRRLPHTAGPETVTGAKAAFRASISPESGAASRGSYIVQCLARSTTSPVLLLHAEAKPDSWCGYSNAGIDWKVNMGVVVLLMLVVISAIAVWLVPDAALLLRSRAHGRQRWLPLLYFVAIGLGYIAVEITLIQRLVLFLGHPIYAMTVVVFLMLLVEWRGELRSRGMVDESGSRV